MLLTAPASGAGTDRATRPMLIRAELAAGSPAEPAAVRAGVDSAVAGGVIGVLGAGLVVVVAIQ